eukprot:12861313-Heterocapsa_arctica.AAC.1
MDLASTVGIPRDIIARAISARASGSTSSRGPSCHRSGGSHIGSHRSKAGEHDVQVVLETLVLHAKP